MGMLTPKPPVFGDNCITCDPDLWATGKTPLYVKATIALLVPCPAAPAPAPNGIWVLKQHALHPCQWILTTNLYSFAWQLPGVGSEFDIVCTPKPWKFYFNGSSPGNCDVNIDNGLVDCLGVNTYAHSGTVQIGWP